MKKPQWNEGAKRVLDNKRDLWGQLQNALDTRDERVLRAFGYTDSEITKCLYGTTVKEKGRGDTASKRRGKKDPHPGAGEGQRGQDLQRSDEARVAEGRREDPVHEQEQNPVTDR